MAGLAASAHDTMREVSSLREAALLFEEIGLATDARRCREKMATLRDKSVAEKSEGYMAGNDG